MTQLTNHEDDQGDVMATPVNARWIWSMLLFVVICIMMASLCSVIPILWDDDMKNLNVMLFVALAFGVVSCSVSNQPVAPQATATPDPKIYVAAYFKYLTEWSTGVHGVQDVNKKLADGTDTLASDALKVQLATALTDLEEASDGMSGLTPPLPQLQYFQAKGRELDAQTKIFTSNYVKALSGDDGAKETATTAFNSATTIYSEIVTEFNKLTDIMMPD